MNCLIKFFCLKPQHEERHRHQFASSVSWVTYAKFLIHFWCALFLRIHFVEGSCGILRVYCLSYKFFVCKRGEERDWERPLSKNNKKKYTFIKKKGRLTYQVVMIMWSNNELILLPFSADCPLHAYLKKERCCSCLYDFFYFSASLKASSAFTRNRMKGWDAVTNGIFKWSTNKLLIDLKNDIKLKAKS